jgi:hypothetical protein
MNKLSACMGPLIHVAQIYINTKNLKPLSHLVIPAKNFYTYSGSQKLWAALKIALIN